MFSTEVSEAIKKQLPQLTSYQIQKIVIDRWAKMTEREKQNYREKALEDMNRYPSKSSSNNDQGQTTQIKKAGLMANVSSISVTNGGTSSTISSNRSLLKDQLQTLPSGAETKSAGRVVQNNSGKKMVKMKLNGPDGICKEILVPAVDGPNGTLKVAIPRNYSVPPGGNCQVKAQGHQAKQQANMLPKIAPRPTLQTVSISGDDTINVNSFLEINVNQNEFQKEMHYEDPEEEEAEEDEEEVEQSDSDGEWTPSKENMSQKRKRNRF